MKCPFELPLRKYQADKNSAYCEIHSLSGHIADLVTLEDADYIIYAINSYEKQVKHVEALKSVCEKYIPTEQLDKANDEVILLCEGNVEEIGRKLLAKQTGNPK